MRKRRSLYLGLVLALVANLLQFTVIPAARACAETVIVYSFHVEISSPGKAYRIGQVAKIDVKVTRPNDEDPLGLGVPLSPPMEENVEGANVGVGLQVGDVFLPGYALTKEDGVAHVKIKLEPWTQPGSADVRALAWLETADGGCLIVEEQGFAQEDNLFVVTR